MRIHEKASYLYHRVAFDFGMMLKQKLLTRIQFSSSRHFNHNAASVPTFDEFSNVRTPEERFLAIPKSIAIHVSKCLNLKQLRIVFARIIQTGFLELYPYPFHYNNISRMFTRLHSPREALLVIFDMHRAGILWDNFTFPIVLKAASQKLDGVLARQVHGVAIKYGQETDMYSESGLISVYSKVGDFEMAQKVFLRSPERKLGSWNAIIAGLSQGGRGKEAIQMFVEMMRNGLCPDDVTMVCVTSACGALGDLNLALQLHKCVFQAMTCAFQAMRLGKSSILMMNSLIDMYGKCGRIDLAYKVFCEMEEKNVYSWTSMIVSFAAHGLVEDALACFSCMREVGITPNRVTFVGMLSACVHGGMVQEGKYYFNLMKNYYGIEPMLPHYGCMVDLLGRAGLLEEAKLMMEEMPVKASVVIWGCLMGACEKYGNVELGEWVAKHMIELEPENDGVFVALSNIYANNGMWKEYERLRENMKKRKLAKIPSYTLLER